MDALYKVRIICDDNWQTPMKPIYIVAKSKEHAGTYANTYIRAPYKVGSVSRLGAKMGNNMFSGNS